MQIGEYKFHCTLKNDAILPPYKGSTFRGAFGGALKRAVCVTKQRECADCILAERCIYAQTFESNRRSMVERENKKSKPVPYLIEPPLESRTFYSAGSAFDFSLLLFGDANQSLPYFVYAFEIMGESGIGKKICDKRGSFIVDEVSCNDEVIYNSATRKLKIHKLSLLENPTTTDNGAQFSIRIKMLTPLRLKYHNEFSEKLPFHLLTRTMLRRISSLFENYGDGEPPLDYRGLVSKAEDIKIVSSTLHWHDWERYSNRQEQAMLMGGVLGEITYSGKLTPYLPLLKLCKSLHIGKQSSFGLGLFDYEIIKPD